MQYDQYSENNNLINNTVGKSNQYKRTTKIIKEKIIIRIVNCDKLSKQKIDAIKKWTIEESIDIICVVGHNRK